jgi:hypothetical protein
MDISTIVNSWWAWLTDQLALISNNWIMLATFGAAVGFLLAANAVIRGGQTRAHRDELRVIRNELSGLNERLNALEALERRRIGQSLHRPAHNRMDTEAAHFSGEKKIPVAPK